MTDEIKLATPEQCLSFGARVATKVGKLGIPFDALQAALDDGSGHPVYAAIEAVLLPKPAAFKPGHLNDYKRQVADWADFYKKFFGIDLDMTGVKIPFHIEGFDRLIIVAGGVSINQVYEKGKENFSSWKWCDDDLESKMQESERGETKTSYAIWVRDEREADKDLLGKSALDVKRPKDTESLLERLLHGFKYWSETGGHLDVRTYTLCAGSRYSDGDVPGVSRDGGGVVCVGGCDPQGRDGGIGARRAVR